MGGMTSIDEATPAKNIEPSKPTFHFGSHKRSNLSGLTQLSKYSSSSVSGLYYSFGIP